MPSPFTSSFASAAAGNANESGSAGSGDWSRARTNGNTATFRRSSGANNLMQRGESATNSINHSTTGSVYAPPHMNPNYLPGPTRNGNMADTRYSKDQLLDLFRAQQDKTSQAALEDLFVDGWNPKNVNDNAGVSWGRSDERKDIYGPEICWDQDGSVQPLNLLPLDDEEKEVFSGSVNSPIKPPTQNKDGMPNTPGPNRRTSLSQSQGSANASSRPGNRQRGDSSDLLNNPLTSPTNNRFSKEESNVASPPPSLLRRKTESKDAFGPGIEDKAKESGRPTIDTSSPMSSLKRTATNPLSAALNGPSSPWSAGPVSAGFTPMGAFGSFGAPQSATERKTGFGRSESRFKSLMGGGSSEDMKKPQEQNQLRLASESLDDPLRSPWESGPSRQRRDLGDLYEDVTQQPAGSAALGGDDASPPTAPSSRSLNYEGQSAYDGIGFSSMSMSTDSPFPDFTQQNRNLSHHAAQQMQSQEQSGEPLSPTYTNPYQSPQAERAVPSDIELDDSQHPHYQQSGPLGRGFAGQLDPIEDRSQTSSTTASRAFSNLSSLGGLSSIGAGPWSTAPGAVGTPSRAFGESAFGGFGDVVSPSNAGFGASGFFGTSGPSGGGISASAGRGSRLGSFFPSAMHEQPRSDPHRQEQGLRDHEPSQTNITNVAAFPGLRENDSTAALNRSRLDDLLNSSNMDERVRGQLPAPFAAKDSSQAPPSASLQAPFSATSTSNFFGGSQDHDQSGNQLPASQQRQMVMPDRMRWIYRDPQGAQQGPWSGLEMHDWYKAGFFSPELQVKKLEENDYEPLAQLIRRIGNSREPFLVPQIGIPHGPPSAPPNTGSQPPTQQAGSSSAQPPFASSFPSFGTTLTAEQQNALERRKQEEQYLMARQKEHLAAMQPVLQRQMQQHMQGGLHNQQLHHHSSAHSLQSQPSYGSITSPGGYQPTPGAGPIQPPSAGPNYLDMQRGAGPMHGEGRDDDLPGLIDRMNLGRGGQMPYGAAPQAQDQYHQQQANAAFQERARLQREQQQFEQSTRGADEDRPPMERLEEFQRLRAQVSEQRLQQQQALRAQENAQQYSGEQQVNHQPSDEQLSLSEQVQKTKNEAGMPQPFPPPQPSSPMPAPTPQRNRQSVAEALNAESQSQTPSQVDSADTLSAAMAPWAKEPAEVSKGPSLKEIQVMEAKKAAQQEEIAVAARRAVAEQERMAQQNQPIAPAPGLPSSANWASSVSPAVPAPSPLSKPASGKTAVATPATGQKKTLAQIQKEEEARKNKTASAAAAANVNTAAGPGGKRYADLASKTAAPTPLNANRAPWTTVGASGKVKAPAAPSPAPARTVSGTLAPVAARPKPVPSATSTASSQQGAHEDFQRWIRHALGKGLNPGIPVDHFVSSLLSLPPEADLISDSIYASSQTLDGRRFADEFVKRRRLADKGVVPDTGTSSFSTAEGAKGGGSGGWSEVAKKGPVAGGKQDPSKEFRVVAGKKKGKR